MESVEGIVQEIIFTNEANGYTICELKGEAEEITLVGYMPFINEGETLKASGKWVVHPEYGRQLKVELYEKVLPHTADEILKYLSSGAIKGIGPSTAQKIIKRFGQAALDIIRNEPQKLSEIKGISFEKALKIGQAYEEQSEFGRLVMFVQEYGISPSAASNIHKLLGKTAIDDIKENPYRLADQVYGISFKTADDIAKRLGIDAYSRFRLSSGIKYVLLRASLNGHTYLPMEKLVETAADLLSIEPDQIKDALVYMSLEKTIHVEKSDSENRVYLAGYYNSELSTTRRLMELSSVTFTGSLPDIEEQIRIIQDEEGIELADLQKTAVMEAMQNGVLVITGGPGTGKTTIIKSIIKLFLNEGLEVVLAAPTGRAAKRMTEATGFEAKTIHRLLETGYSGKGQELLFAKNEENPIDADVIIIDEMSMVDILVMDHLLRAVEPGTRLIMAGDSDQLPSVGPGNVLKDIIGSGAIKTVMLTDIFRQAQESMITINAHKINRGEMPEINVRDKDFFFMGRPSPEGIVETVIELCSRRLPSTYSIDPLKDIQVLTPSRKGPVGVPNLNAGLQKVLNPPDKTKAEKAVRGAAFREGDRVMQVKNNYNLRWEKAGMAESGGTGVFNGDMGVISRISEEEQKVVVVFDDEKIAEYDFSILDELEQSFAITIHKSQGSEFPVIIIPLYQGPPVLMTRNLLYTAVTRAKSLVVIVGRSDTLTEMVNNQRQALRYSGLCEKLAKISEIGVGCYG